MAINLSIGISTAITNMWKGIYKTELTGEQTEIDNKPDDYPVFHPSNAISQCECREAGAANFQIFNFFFF